MPIKSDAQRRAVAKYNAANYEPILFRVKKGGKDRIKVAADRAGMSLNEFIVTAVYNAISTSE